MRILSLLCFLLALPVVAVLGHDIWIAYGKEDGVDLSRPFNFSDIGWLWVQYGPETYDWASKNLDPALWRGFVEPLLSKTALAVVAVPAGVFYLVLFALRALGVWPFQDSQPLITISGKRDGRFAFKDIEEGRKIRTKYKRK